MSEETLLAKILHRDLSCCLFSSPVLYTCPKQLILLDFVLAVKGKLGRPSYRIHELQYRLNHAHS